MGNCGCGGGGQKLKIEQVVKIQCMVRRFLARRQKKEKIRTELRKVGGKCMRAVAGLAPRHLIVCSVMLIGKNSSVFLIEYRYSQAHYEWSDWRAYAVEDGARSDSR